MEIERRFFVRNVEEKPWMKPQSRRTIEQYYLDSERFSTQGDMLVYDSKHHLASLSRDEICLFEEEKEWTSRIRICDDVATVTLKGKRIHASALELEWVVNRDLTSRILEDAEFPAVFKSRYLWVGGDGNTWEIDHFEGTLEGLVLAEIELSSIDDEIHIPQWIGAEITGKHQWSNSSLAYNGIP
jgi:CYTH domain-containing protein